MVVEVRRVGKLGTVTDLASVHLRSISAGLKLNTTSWSALLRTYLYTGSLSSKDHNPAANGYLNKVQIYRTLTFMLTFVLRDKAGPYLASR